MLEKVSANVMFMKTAKELWDILMYFNEHNSSRVANLHEKLSTLRQDGRSLSNYYAELKGTLDE